MTEFHSLTDTYELTNGVKIPVIGVSNFRRHHLDALLETAEIKPVVKQICLNPSDLLGNQTIKEVGAKYSKSAAQVLIRWSLQHGFLPLPKLVHPDYIKANADIFDFELTASDMAALDGLKGIGQPVLDPDQADF